jgi:hypothetical protein
VRLTLADGSQIDDCELVSAGHHGVESLWVCADGADMFVPLVEVTDVREVITSTPGPFPLTRPASSPQAPGPGS